MENSKNLPTIPLRGIIPIPNNDFRIEVGRKKSLEALEVAEKETLRYVILSIQKNPLIDEPTYSDIHSHGILAMVSMKLKLPNNVYKVKFNLVKRVKITNFISDEKYDRVDYEELETINDNADELLAASKMILDEIGANVDLINNGNQILERLSGQTTPEIISDVISFNLKIESDSKYKYVEESNVLKRLKNILIDLNYQELVASIEQKISDDVKKAIDENQKEYILREKLKAIQNELGDKVKKDEEVEQLRKDIIQAKMPSDIEKHALAELNRYAQSSIYMAESGVIKTYLDFIISLPWHKKSKDLDDVKKVQEILDKNHYGLNQVKDKILEYLSVQIKTKKVPQAILCLVGPPGTGKTSLAISIAEALNKKFVKQSLGGVKDESEIMGHRRTYVGALPGRILKGMAKAGVVNPVFLLDEIDKLSSDSYRGDPSSSLLEVLDPDQNYRFSDHYLEDPYDLSKVMFITTANYLENIPEPLRDRMEIVELSSYTELEKFNIATTYLIDNNLKAHGITNKEFSITNDCIYDVIRYYTREAGVRELNRLIGTLIRKVIKKILIDKVESIEITSSNLEEFLGKKKFAHNIAAKNNRVGVVTGLAYTSFGGDTLDVEVNYFAGKGMVSLTGKLGDVMKESAQIAFSYIRSQAKEFKIDEKMFSENDFHIHFPEGAVPKDGPSAGVTIATAIYSALTKRPARSDLGMTGEISLRGNILPIGGLKEKSIAASRSGLKTILIPKENVKDTDDIPSEIKEKLQIIPIEKFEDVLDVVFK